MPLREVSVQNLFVDTDGEKCTYEIPVYQRNYAWESDEITALVQDVYDACQKDPASVYYIGTLVTYYRGDQRYEVIDGQQRLTTIRLILAVLNVPVNNRLTYTARKKSDETIRCIPDFEKVDEKDIGIENGYKWAKEAIRNINPEDLERYRQYFLNHVHLIRYRVQKDIDLNQYFEVMNSRGEQLEMHEIVKANLMQRLSSDEERRLFHLIWEACSSMNVYVQQNLEGITAENIFGKSLQEFLPGSFEEILQIYMRGENEEAKALVSIEAILDSKESPADNNIFLQKRETKDTFLPIIDFPNFLLIVLKMTRMKEAEFDPADFMLDDKELLNEFRKKDIDVKQFAFYLLRARFLLDNYVVHHAKEDETPGNSPWKLQVCDRNSVTGHLEWKRLCDDKDLQTELVHLLSMFEVSFTARQRKNYLFYCLFYLMQSGRPDVAEYRDFVRRLADSYFQNIYLNKRMLNARNAPLPGSFDAVILNGRQLDASLLNAASFRNKKDPATFNAIYGDGAQASRGVPLFVFNYLDYKIWKYYADTLRGEAEKDGSPVRREFFERLGCSDFGLNVFKNFYFSRTRRSLEHFYPQANADGQDGHLDQNQINCFGNYAMIGSEVNSSGSNWIPKTKLDHYLDPSGKINQVSVASLKFAIMMQMCRDRSEAKEPDCWTFREIQEHQSRMVSFLMHGSSIDIAD